MIARNHWPVAVDDNLNRYIQEMECRGIPEQVEALQTLITRAAMIIAKKTNPDEAQCILYKPYKMLAEKIDKPGGENE